MSQSKSYLGFPRLHFKGKFQANPGTINNVPQNYDVQSALLPGQQLENLSANTFLQPVNLKDIQLYWNPNGNGVFDLKDCIVTRVVYEDGTQATTAQQDPLVGQSLNAVYTKGQPKIVDLDPEQQWVSEIWGLEIQAGGITAANPNAIPDAIRGEFVPAPFTAMWAQSKKGVASGALSAVYQGQLQSVSISGAQESPFVKQLQELNPQALSINFVVNAHNNSPEMYLFNDSTFAVMKNKGVDSDALARLEPMQLLFVSVGSDGKPADCGNVPTESFVNLMLANLLTEEQYRDYQQIVLDATRQSYIPGTPNPFTFGDVVGTIGLSAPREPRYFAPSRMLTPSRKNALFIDPRPVNFVPFSVQRLEGGKAVITANLGNALPTDRAGLTPDASQIGTLTLVWFDVPAGEDFTIEDARPLQRHVPFWIGELSIGCEQRRCDSRGARAAGDRCAAYAGYP